MRIGRRRFAYIDFNGSRFRNRAASSITPLSHHCRPADFRRRVQQDHTFLPGREVEVGAEFIHGDINQPSELCEVRRFDLA